MQKNLISRQEAIDTIMGQPPEPHYPSWYAAQIEGLPPVQSELHWIPCSERLSNHDEYIKNNGLFIVSDGNRSYSEWYDIYDKRKFGEPTMSGFRIDYAVTAWMPLPEPYRG